MERQLRGRHFAIVVVAEGAYPAGGAPSHDKSRAEGGMRRLGGIGEWVADELAGRTGNETRSLVLGHIQRGGSPDIVPVPLAEATATLKSVPLDSDKILTARDLGVSLGD